MYLSYVFPPADCSPLTLPSTVQLSTADSYVGVSVLVHCIEGYRFIKRTVKTVETECLERGLRWSIPAADLECDRTGNKRPYLSETPSFPLCHIVSIPLVFHKSKMTLHLYVVGIIYSTCKSLRHLELFLLIVTLPFSLIKATFVRLNGPHVREGRAEFLDVNGTWGTICDTAFGKTGWPSVFCFQLGYPGIISAEYIPVHLCFFLNPL